MGKIVTLNVRVGGTLGEFVSTNVGESGAYENVSEYVRDLIRRDMERADDVAFARLKSELTQAFSAPSSSSVELTADDIIARNRRKS